MFKKLIKPVYAHCDVPCGIYETDTMMHAAQTCKRMVEKYPATKGADEFSPEVVNTAVRCIETKEKHAQLCKDQLYLLWSDYFKPEHLEKYPDLHQKFWTATKQCSMVKQHVSVIECDKLIEMVHDIAHMFEDSKQAA